MDTNPASSRMVACDVTHQAKHAGCHFGARTQNFCISFNVTVPDLLIESSLLEARLSVIAFETKVKASGRL